MTKLICPQCGHHIGNLATPQPPAPDSRRDGAERFVREHVKIGGGWFTAAEAFSAYVDWAIKEGVTPGSRKMLAGALKDAGMFNARSHQTRVWSGGALLV